MQTVPDPAFVLNGQTLLAIGGILGALAGAITFLFKVVMSNRDKELEDVRRERDMFREMLLEALSQARSATEVADKSAETARELAGRAEAKPGTRARR